MIPKIDKVDEESIELLNNFGRMLHSNARDHLEETGDVTIASHASSIPPWYRKYYVLLLMSLLVVFAIFLAIGIAARNEWTGKDVDATPHSVVDVMQAVTGGKGAGKGAGTGAGTGTGAGATPASSSYCRKKLDLPVDQPIHRLPWRTAGWSLSRGMSVLPTFPLLNWEKVPVFAQRTSKTGYDLSVLSNVALKNREYSTRRINQRKFQGYIVVWYHTGPHTQQVCPASIKKILVESYGNADQV